MWGDQLCGVISSVWGDQLCGGGGGGVLSCASCSEYTNTYYNSGNSCCVEILWFSVNSYHRIQADDYGVL